MTMPIPASILLRPSSIAWDFSSLVNGILGQVGGDLAQAGRRLTLVFPRLIRALIEHLGFKASSGEGRPEVSPAGSGVLRSMASSALCSAAPVGGVAEEDQPL